MTQETSMPTGKIAPESSENASGCADELKDVKERLADTEAALEVAQAARVSALYDHLTKLANRALFEEQLSTAIAMADRRQWSLALLFIDIDSFKAVNDTHGHEIGDTVLQEIARRLLACARDEDTVCRYGGDEFVCLLIDPRSRKNISNASRRIKEAISEPIEVAGQAISVRASVGVSVYPDDGLEIAQLIRNSDVAMYCAKKRGTDYEFFSQEELLVRSELSAAAMFARTD